MCSLSKDSKGGLEPRLPRSAAIREGMLFDDGRHYEPFGQRSCAAAPSSRKAGEFGPRISSPDEDAEGGWPDSEGGGGHFKAFDGCSAPARAAASAYRRIHDTLHLSVIVHGLIERFVRQDARPKWDRLGEEARLAEDLGVDSLTILEIVCRAEEGFQVSIDNEEIRALRTVGEFKRFIIAKLEKKSRALRESACTHSAHGPAPSFVYFPGKDTLGARWVAFPATGVPACPPVASGTAKPGNDLSGPSGGISGPKHLC